jgi:LysM repeat protein
MSRISTTLARVLAILALAAVALAIFLVVSSALDESDTDGNGGTPAVQREGNANRGDNGSQNQGGPPRFYVVQPGDTLTAIAEETGVSLERIQDLNPNLDPQILNSGERLRLR